MCHYHARTANRRLKEVYLKESSFQKTYQLLGTAAAMHIHKLLVTTDHLRLCNIS